MRIGIAQQQSDLEEQHTGGPDGCGTAEPGKDQFRNQGLNGEKQKRAKENGGREEKESGAPLNYMPRFR